MITRAARAKINLTLDVLYKRDDGFHQVEMIMQALELADELEFFLLPGGEIVLEVDDPRLPADETNLAYRAAALLKETFQVKQGVRIVLKKAIPMAAGLAGGSADAAAVLAGLNELWNLQISLAELEVLAAQLGSDIPFCLRGGTMLAVGRGEQLVSLPDFPACYVVLAKLPVGVPTPWVYGQYRSEAVAERPDTQGVIRCLEAGDQQGVIRRLCNVLESVTIPAHPEIALLKAKMLEYGALASLMSGSGPTVFGLVDSQEKAESIARRLQKETTAEIIVTKTGVKVGEECGTSVIAN